MRMPNDERWDLAAWAILLVASSLMASYLIVRSWIEVTQ